MASISPIEPGPEQRGGNESATPRIAEIERAIRQPLLHTRFGYDVPVGLASIWISCGPWFQLNYPLDDEQRVDALVYWWIQSGRIDFPGLRGLLDWELLSTMHARHLNGPALPGSMPLTPLLRLITRHRPDVSARFDPTTPKGLMSLWEWWDLHGREELFGSPLWLLDAEGLAAQRRGIEGIAVRSEPLPVEEAALDIDVRKISAGGFERLIPKRATTIYLERKDVRRAYDIWDSVGGARFVNWIYENGLSEIRDLGESLEPEILALLSAPISKAYQAVSPPWAGWLFELRWHAELPVSQGASGDIEAAGAWWEAEGRHRFTRLDALLSRHASRPEADLEPTALPPATTGIGLVGYPRAEFGLGEDIRMLRVALQSAGIEPAVVRAPWKIAARQWIAEPEIEAHEAEFASDVMFYVMPASDTLTLLNKHGPQAFTARRRIGFWQWELERFPEVAKLAMTLVDEIWCHSAHAERSFRAATDKPVVKVPLPVRVPEVEPAPRAQYGLGEDDFVVFTSFDGNSMIARKNPLGAVHSFERAFPRGGRQARLVLKAMNTGSGAFWNECLRRAEVDDRILIINEVIDRQAYYQLLRTCDAVLSLHRAEGFGRLMAEAMALGIPTIASGYSGNLDFMTADNSWLVEGDMVTVRPGDYPFHEGQRWFEPDLDAAVAALNECAEDADLRRVRGLAGQRTILERYSPEACGRVYAELLG